MQPCFDDLYEQMSYKKVDQAKSVLEQHTRTSEDTKGQPPWVLRGKWPGRQEEKDKTDDNRNHIQNAHFIMDLKQLGVDIGKISTILKKAGPGDVQAAACPMIQGHQACLTWHTKGHCWDHFDSHITPGDVERESLASLITEGLRKIK
jgi:hypothetical protein